MLKTITQGSYECTYVTEDSDRQEWGYVEFKFDGGAYIEVFFSENNEKSLIHWSNLQTDERAEHTANEVLRRVEEWCTFQDPQIQLRDGELSNDIQDDGSDYPDTLYRLSDLKAVAPTSYRSATSYLAGETVNMVSPVFEEIIARSILLEHNQPDLEIYYPHGPLDGEVKVRGELRVTEHVQMWWEQNDVTPSDRVQVGIFDRFNDWRYQVATPTIPDMDSFTERLLGFELLALKNYIEGLLTKSYTNLLNTYCREAALVRDAEKLGRMFYIDGTFIEPNETEEN